MRALTVPATLITAHLAFGCSTSVPSDASADGRSDAVLDALRDAIDVGDGSDATSDLQDAVVDASDATSDTRSDGSDASDGPTPVCEGARDADGGVVCREENVQGTGLFCIRYRCEADDGGATLNDCCRLVG